MSRVDKEARRLLDEYEVAAPPINVHALAEGLGVAVVHTSMPEDVSGMLIRDETSLTIGLNRAQTPRRQRFTLAHELGHLQLHRGRPLIVDSSVRVNLRDATSAQATDREEMEANRFAAALLMPEHLVRDAVSGNIGTTPAQIPRELAHRFDVSIEAMGYRLINLGITT